MHHRTVLKPRVWNVDCTWGNARVSTYGKMRNTVFLILHELRLRVMTHKYQDPYLSNFFVISHAIHGFSLFLGPWIVKPSSLQIMRINGALKSHLAKAWTPNSCFESLGQFHQHFMSSSYTRRLQKCKKDSQI